MASASIILRLRAERETTDYVRYDEPHERDVDTVLRSQRVNKRALVQAFGHVPKSIRVTIEPGAAPGSALEV